MNDTQHRTINYVAAEPTIDATPATSLIRRQDVVEVTGQMIRAYSEQQKALLAQIQDDTLGNSSGFLSDASQVAERRRTSGMYLRVYTLVSALTTGGLAYLAHLAGADGAASLAGWLAGTGALTLLLAWRRHGQEMQLSPEGIARHLLDWHGEIASYESETRRKAIEWEHEAERRRQAAANATAEHARRLAELRIAELDTRRRTIEAQQGQRDTTWLTPERQFAVQWQVEGEPETTQTVLQTPCIENEVETPTGVSWQAALLAWIGEVYQPGAITEAGVIRIMVPWSARSPWTEADKAEAKRVMCGYKPALIVHDGNRWRLRTDLVSTVEQALQIVGQRL